MKGMRQPKSTKFSSDSVFFMMTETTDPSNVPRLAVPSAVIDVALWFLYKCIFIFNFDGGGHNKNTDLV